MTTDLLFWRSQALRLAQLLEEAKDDPILAPQLEERLHDARHQLSECERQPDSLLPRELPPLPRVALFLRGSSVDGSTGIRPSLAGEALLQYEKLFEEQALHDERVIAQQQGRQRRLRGSPRPELLFTGTPRGSFGLEFVPRAGDAPDAMVSHGQSLHRVAEVLSQLSLASDDLDQATKGIPPRVLQNAKAFFSVLAKHDTELRLAFDNRDAVLIPRDRIALAASLLERELRQATIQQRGVFRGLTRETMVFDFRADDGAVISGELDDTLTEDDFDRLDGFTNKECEASLERTEIHQLSRLIRTNWVLLDLHPSGATEKPDPTSNV